MMRKALFTVMLAFTMMAGIQAKTIHWLTFIDTTDEWIDKDGSKKGVGEMDKNIRKILYSRWIDIVNATLKENGYDINIIDVYDRNTSPENCKKIINELNCGPEDIIVFYYIGHGTENTGTSKFPLMFLAQHDLSRLVPLSWVHNTLKNKGARLTISIGMCCNVRQEVPGRAAPSFSMNYGNTYVDVDQSECIKKMFLNYKGDLIITSASPKEASWGYYFENIGMMDYFTLNLIEQFNNVLPNQNNPTWESMLTAIKKNVYDDIKNNPNIQRKEPGATQTPIWDSNLISASSPSKTTPDKPKTDTDNATDKSDYVNVLNKLLAYISSTNVNEIDRMAVAEKYKSVFSPNLIVRIMSQDGNVVVDKESISTYLGRISTSRLLMNVSVVDLSIDANGRISSLRVREVYKKR